VLTKERNKGKGVTPGSGGNCETQDKRQLDGLRLGRSHKPGLAPGRQRKIFKNDARTVGMYEGKGRGVSQKEEGQTTTHGSTEKTNGPSLVIEPADQNAKPNQRNETQKHSKGEKKILTGKGPAWKRQGATPSF